jgi:hypothetical protein
MVASSIESFRTTIDDVLSVMMADGICIGHYEIADLILHPSSGA